MPRGDHFFVWRRHRGIPFQHHGIDLGDGTVVHFSDGEDGIAGPGGSTVDFEVRRTAITVVTRDGRDTIHVIEHSNRLDPELIAERALSQVGRREYHLIFDNCEHFACWCVIDRQESRQVTIACQRAGAVGVKAIATGSIRAASKLGATRLIRGASPWLLVADAAQWATEAGGHHVGLRNPQKRKQASMAIGGVAAIGVGSIGGPVGIVIAGGIWFAGELAGEASRRTYERFRLRKRVLETMEDSQLTADNDTEGVLPSTQ